MYLLYNASFLFCTAIKDEKNQISLLVEKYNADIEYQRAEIYRCDADLHKNRREIEKLHTLILNSAL